MAKILIKNGRIWDGGRFFAGDILTDGKSIANIGTDLTGKADFIFDAYGKTVSAGFVDLHMHMRGISSNQYGIHTEMSTFPFGVTAAAEASAIHGDLRLLESFALKNVVFVPVKIRDNRAELANAEMLLSNYGERAIGVKVFFDTADPELRDGAPLREIADFAHERGLRVMVHSSHSPIPMPELLESLCAGDVLTHTFHGGKNNAAEDHFAAVTAARARGVVIDVGFAGHVHTDFGIFAQAIREGVLPDTLGTDITKCSAYMRGGRYGMTLCMSIARTLGMKEDDIFRAITSSPARALGKADEWGTLAVGRRADLTVIDYTAEGFHLTDAAGNSVADTMGYRCDLTVSDGQIVYRH